MAVGLTAAVSPIDVSGAAEALPPLAGLLLFLVGDLPVGGAGGAGSSRLKASRKSCRSTSADSMAAPTTVDDIALPARSAIWS